MLLCSRMPPKALAYRNREFNLYPASFELVSLLMYLSSASVASRGWGVFASALLKLCYSASGNAKNSGISKKEQKIA